MQMKNHDRHIISRKAEFIVGIISCCWYLVISLIVFIYDVSNFARDLLTRVKNDPLFNIMAINKTLYKRIKELDEIRVCIINFLKVTLIFYVIPIIKFVN